MNAPPRRPRFWAHPDFWILLGALAFLAVKVADGRFRGTDFRAYYRAAGRLAAGRPLYFVTDPEAPVPFLYLPAAALWFLPFRALPIAPAAAAWSACNAVLVVVMRRQLRSAVGELGAARLAAFLLAIGFTLERELSVGNVNLLNLVLGLLAVSLAARGRGIGAGAALAVATAAKPPNALLALPLAWRDRRLLAAFLLGMLVLLALPLAPYGPGGTADLYRDFARSTLEFNRRFAASPKFASTTGGLIGNLLGLAGARGLPYPALLSAGLVAALAALVAAWRRHGGGPAALWVALALVPLSAISDYQVFVLAAPLAYWLLHQSRGWPRPRVALLAGALILYGCNWHDLWGERLSEAFFRAGLHGLGTWGLIALALARRAPPAAR